MELNDTSLIYESVNIFCDEYKKLDKNVCHGAAYEYIVRLFFVILKSLFEFLQPAVFQVIELATVTDTELCSLAFECKPQTDYPALMWNVTLPDTPKPTPRPPQPPSVSTIRTISSGFSVLFYEYVIDYRISIDCSLLHRS